MSAEFVIAGRIDLPARDKPWSIQIDNAEGGIEVYEASAAGVTEQVKNVVGWEPKSIVFVRKAWELAEVVAEELATALRGAVYCDVDGDVTFDAADAPRPAHSLPELEARLRHAFDHPESVLARKAREDKDRIAADPAAAEGNDWSDV
jgi:hypothetical protein